MDKTCSTCGGTEFFVTFQETHNYTLRVVDGVPVANDEEDNLIDSVLEGVYCDSCGTEVLSVTEKDIKWPWEV